MVVKKKLVADDITDGFHANVSCLQGRAVNGAVNGVADEAGWASSERKVILPQVLAILGCSIYSKGSMKGVSNHCETRTASLGYDVSHRAPGYDAWVCQELAQNP